jgi:large subunit ribosomal protein L25
MSDSVKIALESRTVLGKKVKTLRRNGVIPATVYGKNVGPLAVQVDARHFQEIYRRAGRTRVIEVTIPGEPMLAAFIHVIQRHPVSREIIHIDFHAVDLRIEVTIAVPIHLVGSSLLVQRGDAILNQAMTTIEVNALPANLPSHIDLDISGLDSFDKALFVSDLAVPEGTTISVDPEELIVNLSPVRAEVEEEPAEAETAEPELVREEREDEE